MKKIITALMLLMLSLPILRASSEEHMKFKGIPISGSKENFIKELKKQGFKSSDFGELQGVFAQRNCYISLLTTPISNQVYQVFVVYDNFNSWSELKMLFQKLETQLLDKYSVNISTGDTKEFLYPYEEGDGYEFTAIRNNKCVYTSFIVIEYGTIALHVTSLEGVIVLALSYEDKKGNILEEKETKQLLQSDL